MLYCLQLTWVPNELEGFDVAVFESVERLSEPRGWLYKLWEVVLPGGLLVFSSSWNPSHTLSFIGQWQASLYYFNLFVGKPLSNLPHSLHFSHFCLQYISFPKVVLIAILTIAIVMGIQAH